MKLPIDRPISSMLLEIYRLGKTATESSRLSDMDRLDQIRDEIIKKIVSQTIESVGAYEA